MHIHRLKQLYQLTCSCTKPWVWASSLRRQRGGVIYPSLGSGIGTNLKVGDTGPTRSARNFSFWSCPCTFLALKIN